MTTPEDKEVEGIDLTVRTIENLIHSGVAVDIPHGVVLSPKQVSDLIFASTKMGYQNAIDLLQATADAANAPGPDHNLTQWAVFHASASFLEGAKG